MNAPINTPDVKAARAATIAATIDRIRGIEAAQGVTRPALEAIRAELPGLAAKEHLFPSADVAPPPNGEKGSCRYLLQSDPGNRFALCMNALNPGNGIKPHDRTTWVVVVAVDGQELNKVYQRLDDGSDPGRCEIRLAGEVMVVVPYDKNFMQPTAAAG